MASDPAGLRRARLGGAAVAAAAVALVAFLGSTAQLGYDSAWHVFIARQPRWPELLAEIRDNAHPPLYYLALRGALAALGHSLLATRAVGIACLGACGPLMAAIVYKLSRSALLATLSAAVLLFSPCVIEVGLEVRSYALMLFCLLAAFSGYLDWLLGPRPTARARIQFALGASLAIWSHYSALFFLVAAPLAPVCAAFLPVSRRRIETDLREHPIACLTMFTAPWAAALAVWAVHLRHYRNPLNHVPGFLYQAGRETAFAFVARNALKLVAAFAPGLSTAAAALVLGLACLAFLLLLRRALRSAEVMVPLSFVVLLLTLNLAAALRGRYPFGGEARHEIFLFPFLVVVSFVAAEEARRFLTGLLGHSGLWTALTALLASAGLASGFQYALPSRSADLAQLELDKFEVHVDRPAVVLLSQFNLIDFFNRYRAWTWNVQSEVRSERMWQVWQVRRGGQSFEVCRTFTWELNPAGPELYEDLDNCLRRTGKSEVALFFNPQGSNQKAADAVRDDPQLLRRLAAPRGLEPVRVVVERAGIHGLFVRSGAFEARLELNEASYGANCGAIHGNASAASRARCSSTSCALAVAAMDLPDPAPGCAKELTVEYACEGLRRPSARLSPEAAGQLLLLACGPYFSTRPKK